LQSRYRNILKGALKELPTFPESSGRRGRPKHTDAQNLWLRLKSHEESILRFTIDKNIDFTNNRAERDLRMSKVKQKVSGCFRELEFARHYCRISSFLKTMRYKGYSSLGGIMLALQREILD
jgi:transposase